MFKTIRKSITASLALLLLLPACRTDDTVAPGAVAAAPTVTVASVARGSVAAIGSSPDKSDVVRAQQASIRAYTAPIGQQVTWNNPQTGNSGTIIPVRDGYANNGAYCRELQQTMMVNGQQQQSHSKTCQQPDGSWKTAQ